MLRLLKYIDCRTRRTAWSALFAMGVLFCPGAAKNSWAGESVQIERSQRSRPEWTTRVPAADGKFLYFVGRATGESSLEAAEQDAAADAVRQIVTLIGVEATVSYNRLRQEAGLLLRDSLSLEGASPVVGLKRLETYYEKQTVEGKDSLRVFYDSHLLVRYPLESLQEARMKLEQESTQRVSMAESLLDKGRALESLGERQEAFGCYLEGLEALGGSPAAFGADPARCQALSRELSVAAFRSGLSLRMLELDINSGDSSATGKSLRQSICAALLSAGFTPTLNAGLSRSHGLPQLSLYYEQSEAVRIEDGFWLSLWSASFKLVNPLSGQVILASEYMAKGFGPDSERAALDAMRQMRLELIPRFAREARERLDQLLGPVAVPDESLFFAR